MNFKIVADSGCDITQEMKRNMNMKIIPLTLRLQNKEYVDDENLDVEGYIEDMKNCPDYPKTSCPSPSDFINSFRGEEDVFAVTLSSNLSGTYQSAVTAKDIFLEEAKEKFIHVFDSLSASSGETLVCMKINELVREGLDRLEIVEKVTKYIHDMKTFFLLENLEHLAKAGRLNPIIAKVASVLDIKPIMGSDGAGNIKLVERVRGYKKAFNRLIDIIGREGTNIKDKVLGISYCNCLERALLLREELLKRYNFKDIVIMKMTGLTSTYADDKGLVIAF